MIDSFRSFITAAQKTKKCPEGYRFDKSLGVFIEGNYNKYWNRTWHGFSAGINYRVF